LKRRTLTEREESILSLLKRCDFLTRDQIRKYFGVGTNRHTNRMMFELSDYTNRVRDGYDTIYYLNKRGREYVDCDKVRKQGGHMYHAIMRNHLWLHFGCPSDWRNEIKVSDGKHSVIVDAMFTKSRRYHFIEIDRTQSMAQNKSKVKRYSALIDDGKLTKSIGHTPAVIWLTTTELRRRRLLDASKTLPSVKVYTLEDLR